MITNIKKGLNNKEVIDSRKRHGKNKIESKKRNTFIKLVIESLGDPIIKILIIALAIKLLFLFKSSDIYETLGIVVAIFLASFISAISEYGSEKAFEKLNNENANYKVKVIRNSKKISINMEDLVVGDIVLLESGDKIPADGKILFGEVGVDESALTGESKEKYKNISNNEVFQGSIVTEKSATMIVTNVGASTLYGSIATSIQENTVESPLKSRLRTLAKQISKFGYISAFLILLSYILNVLITNNFNMTFQELLPHFFYALTLSVAVIVMAVPEGLPMMITLVLSSNMKRLLKRNVLVKKLVGIETSGSINILFTDKTGTLTEGKLKVINICDSEFNEYNSLINLNKNIYDLFYQSLIYNNESFIDKESIEGGNSTDKAIMAFCKTDNKDKYAILNKEPFNSKNKYSSVTTNYNSETIFMKGAPEILIKKCNKYIKSNGEIRVLINKEKIINKIMDKALLGYRTLAFCLSFDKGKSYILLGFIFMKDSVRKNTYEGIRIIKKAGIQVVMVTGDSKETAYAVGKELNIINDKDLILTSDEFNSLSDEKVKELLPRLKILARSLPNDKNRLVRLAQELDLTVGMTGDGVNDAPALKRSDVGFCLGSGTEVAKETSDIVILDNNIMSITSAIVYGRTIFKSIRKFIIFQLSVNLCAVLLSLIGPFIGIMSPITVIQMLWINMVIDTFAGLAFSYEPALLEYMEEIPKKRSERIINKYMLNQIICNGIYSTLICIWFLKSNLVKSIYRYDISNKYIMTAFFGLFIFLAIFNAFNARTYRINILSNILKNKVFILIISFIAITQIILIYFGGYIFRTTGLTFIEFDFMLLTAFSIVPFDFIRKVILKKRKIVRGV